MKAAWLGETDVIVEFVNGGANLDLQNKVCMVMNSYRVPYSPKSKSHLFEFLTALALIINRFIKQFFAVLLLGHVLLSL